MATKGFRPIPIFISSPQYGLEDLRAELADYLDEFGAMPLLSSEAGFPDHHGLPPYAQCLRVLESALIIIGIVDRRYGQSMDKWEPYGEYKGLSPTHAELRHALKLRKRLLIYVRSDIDAYYDIYRKNPAKFAELDLPPGLQIEALEMYKELKHHQPAPWIEQFKDVRFIKDSIRKRLLGDLYEALNQRQATVEAEAELLLEQILKMDPSLRKKLMKALSDTPAAKEYVVELASAEHVSSQNREKRKGVWNMVKGFAESTDTLLQVLRTINSLM